MKSKRLGNILKLLLMMMIFTLALTSCGGDSDGAGSKDDNHVCTPVTREVDRVEPSCGKAGSYDVISVCSNSKCGKEFSRETKTIAALTHKFDENNICENCSATKPGAYIRCNASGTPTLNGGYILFGEYPQTLKAENVVITDKTDSRGYYLGKDGNYYAAVTADTYGSKYIFNNGTMIVNETVYYFKVEPIRWKIVTVSGNKALIVCDSIIENMEYQSAYAEENGKYYTDANNAPTGTYASSYEYSAVRKWLTETFYENSFSTLQRAIISSITVENGAESTGNAQNAYAGADTTDKIFLLSMEEVLNTAYGFSADKNAYDEAKMKNTSDYTRAKGIHMSLNTESYGNSWWWLRSPSPEGAGNYVYAASSMGSATYGYYTQYTYGGIVPAMWIIL